MEDKGTLRLSYIIGLACCIGFNLVCSTTIATAEMHPHDHNYVGLYYAVSIVLFVALSPLLANNRFRFSFILLNLGVSFVLCTVIVLEACPESHVALGTVRAFLRSYLSVGSLFLWNIVATLQDAENQPALVIPSVFLGAGVFLLSLMAYDAQIAMLTCILPMIAFTLLAVYDIRYVTPKDSLTSVQSVIENDRKYAVDQQYVIHNSILFFGSRGLWGVVFGILICVRTEVTPLIPHVPLSLACILLLCVLSAFSGLSSSAQAIRRHQIVLVPAAASAILYIAFFDEKHLIASQGQQSPGLRGMHCLLHSYQHIVACLSSTQSSFHASRRWHLAPRI